MTKNGSEIHWTQSRTFWVVASIIVVAIYFFGLTIPLVGPDEPRYAQVAREMFERGDWVTPTLGGYNWFEKPALLYWLEIVSYHIFGITEFAARFGSAVFGLGTVASLWLLVRSIPGETPRRGEISFANLLGLIAASSIGIVVFARGASFDIILTFPLTASLVSYFVWERNKKSILPLVGFYFFIGIALLAKGLIGIVFPFAIVAFYYVLSWKWPSRVLILSLFWGTAVSVIVASAWYLPMYLTHGWTFIDEFFVQHHFQRYTSNKYFHPQPFYFFLWVLPLMTIPWLPFFFLGVWSSVRNLFNRGNEEQKSESSPTYAGGSDLLLFATAWLLVPLVFFSFSGSKLPGYILPSLPPALIFAAVGAARFIGTSKRRPIHIIGMAAASFTVVIVLLLTAVPKFADDDSVRRLIAEADARGYSDAEVLSQHAISHNAEFYAAGRLLRSADGKQVRLYGVSEILNEIRRREGRPVLVLVPNEWAHQPLESPLLKAELITQNSETSIIVARENMPQP